MKITPSIAWEAVLVTKVKEPGNTHNVTRKCQGGSTSFPVILLDLLCSVTYGH